MDSDSGLELDTGGREGTDVLGHLTKVVDRQVGVPVQIVQSGTDLTQALSAGQTRVWLESSGRR
jgi:hypothetical protein